MLLRLFLSFLKIGFLGFGGGYAMLPLILQEGEKFGLTLRQFADLNALDFLVPGPIAINSATYVGQLFGGFIGGLVASLAVTVPSFIFVPLFLRYEETLQGNIYLNGLLEAMKNASVGLILAVAFTLAAETIFPNGFTGGISWLTLGILAVTLLFHLKWDVNPIFLTIAAGVVGYVAYYLQ